jgi:hypothetical protein
MWMEFDYVPRWAFYGFAAGGIVGLIVTWVHRANARAELPETSDDI